MADEVATVPAPAHPPLRSARAPLAALGALAGGIVVVALLAWLLPELVYYPWIWQYYYGPIVADAAGQPLTMGGVTAYSGYNPVNTVTWAVILGISLWNVYAYFQRRDFTITRPLMYAFLPIIVAGGTLRGLIDADWVPEPWAYLFITPNIYVVMFVYTFIALLAGIELERRPAVRARFPHITHWKVVLGAGLAITALLFWGVAGFVLNPPNGIVRWRVLPEIFGYAAVLTAGIVAASRMGGLQFARDPLYVLTLYGQIVDGMQNYIGITMGYTSKLMGTNFLAAWLGDPGLLVGKILLMVPLLAYMKARVEPDPETSENMLMMMLVVVLSLGLAMGFHGGVDLLLGV